MIITSSIQTPTQSYSSYVASLPFTNPLPWDSEVSIVCTLQNLHTLFFRHTSLVTSGCIQYNMFFAYKYYGSMQFRMQPSLNERVIESLIFDSPFQML